MIPILDNGHSGMVGGQYLTAGKRSPNWDKGVLYEGAYNRWVVNLIMRELDYAGVPYYHASPELTDISLTKRVNRANAFHAENPHTYLLSIHANAGGGTGLEGFTSKGNTASDPIAQEFLTGLEGVGQKMRYDFADGDKDKEASYKVLTKTKCPAVLLELGFMDYKKDYNLLWCKKHQLKIAKSIAEVIIKLYRNA